MATMLLRVIIPADHPPLKHLAKIGPKDGKQEYAIVFEVEEHFGWHQPISGGSWLLDVRAKPDESADVVRIEAAG